MGETKRKKAQKSFPHEIEKILRLNPEYVVYVPNKGDLGNLRTFFFQLEISF